MRARPAGEHDSMGTREALIRGAMRVIAREGLRGMTYRAVAAEAGLSHGMIVHHFGSRRALIEAAMDYAAKRSLAGATVAATEDLGELGSDLRHVAEDDEEAIQFLQEVLGEATRRPELMPLARQLISDYEAAVARQLAAHGFEDPDLALVVAAAMDGLVQRQVLFGDGDATDRAMRMLRHLLTASPMNPDRAPGVSRSPRSSTRRPTR